MSLGGPAKCDHQGCEAERHAVNHWYVARKSVDGMHLYEWDKAPQLAMEEGKHFCGLGHMMHYVSSVMTPDETNPNRESTLELKPPLTRDGATPETELLTEKRDEPDAQ